MFRRPWHLLGILIMSLSLTVGFATTAHADGDDMNPFKPVWERTDKPVAGQVVNRTWMWGPSAFTPILREDYEEAPDGQRTVWYFDKARMEVTFPDGDPFGEWYVTNGLLVTELVTGRMQLGDATFEQHLPAPVNVAGDPDDPNAPTYASFAGLLGTTAGMAQEAIVQVIHRDGTIGIDHSLADYEIGTSHFAADTQHWIADPFWNFMTSEGVVYEDGAFVNDALFTNPYYATGYPIVDPFWASVRVGGVAQDVLIQCFERRCLTYTPGNIPGWEVEAGNVGQHYYQWRYGTSTPATLATVYMIAIGDNGQSGMPVGCQDSLIDVTIPVVSTDSVAAEIEAVLTALLALDNPSFSESGLTNALATNDARVEAVTVTDGMAVVDLTGTIVAAGTCDVPRIVGQLEQTVLGIDGITGVDILLNGAPLFES